MKMLLTKFSKPNEDKKDKLRSPCHTPIRYKRWVSIRDFVESDLTYGKKDPQNLMDVLACQKGCVIPACIIEAQITL